MSFTRTSNAISYKDVVYTYPMVATVSAGIVYNKAVFEKAGVGVPRNTQEFYEAMQKIKDKTNAVPVFMNYPSGWTLNQWEGGLLSASGDSEYKRKIIHEDSPFVPGDGHYELYKMMYEVVKRGLCEKDLLASEWEQSKQDLADGKIGCMVLGSWAIQQVKDLAAARKQSDICRSRLKSTEKNMRKLSLICRFASTSTAKTRRLLTLG